MKTDLQLQLDTRTPGSQGAIHAARAGGKVPGVLYEPGGGVTHFAVPLKALQHVLHHGAQHHPVNVTHGADGKSHLAMIKEIQRNMFTGEPMHVDFVVVKQNQMMTLNVPVVVLGEHDLTKQGLMMHLLVREVSVEAKPDEVPDHFEVDISKLKDGDAVTVGDLKAPPGVTITGAAEHQILTIGRMKVQVVEEVAVASTEVKGEAQTPQT